MTEEEAGEILRGIMHSYIGPDHKVMDMQTFYRVLGVLVKVAST